MTLTENPPLAPVKTRHVTARALVLGERLDTAIRLEATIVIPIVVEILAAFYDVFVRTVT
jgi:hypothetical protein